MGDDDRIKALEQAVAADPDFVALRGRLAALLVDAGQPQKALEQYVAILGREPANQEALAGAANAAGQAGDTARATGYRQLLDAIRSAGPASADSASMALGGSPTHDTDDDDDRSPLRVLDGGGRFGEADTDDDDSDYCLENPGITLEDVAGLEEVKRRLDLSFLGPLRNPEVRKMYGKSLRGGLLLYGPPGCGKTFVARALAGEMQAGFLAIGLSDVYSMWMGESERHLKEIFALARRKSPSVLFFDEIDALGHKRSQFSGAQGARNVVNALLHEMDGVGKSDTEGVYYLAATNHPWDVDTALRRPGRFDRMILVLPPDQPAREALLRYHLTGRPVGDINLSRIAAKTEEYSGADLAHLCESAAELAMADSVAGKPRPIGERDFKKALKEIRPSVRAWFDTARNYAMFANEGGMYDDLIEYIRVRGY